MASVAEEVFGAQKMVKDDALPDGQGVESAMVSWQW